MLELYSARKGATHRSKNRLRLDFAGFEHSELYFNAFFLEMIIHISVAWFFFQTQILVWVSEIALGIFQILNVCQSFRHIVYFLNNCDSKN